MSRPEVHGRVLYGADQLVATLVAAHIPEVQARFDKYKALGVLRHRQGEAEPTLIGGVVFHNYHGHDVEMSSVMLDPRWASPDVMRRLFLFPFVTMGCVRMTTITSEDNTAARRADEHMGFKVEGVHPKGWDGVRSAISYGMMRDDCRWIRDRDE